MKILALEFSSSQRSVAVIDAGPQGGRAVVVGEVSQTMKPLSLVEAALREAGIEREQIERLAVGIGPGSYTGIRAAIAIAQGWQLARPVKLLGVSSVEAVAGQAEEEAIHGPVAVVIDAQRDEFYLASFAVDESGQREISPLRLATRTQVLEREQAGELLVGPEVTRWFPRGRTVFPSALALAGMALGRVDFVPGEQLQPIYLRETQFVKAPPPRELI